MIEVVISMIRRWILFFSNKIRSLDFQIYAYICCDCLVIGLGIRGHSGVHLFATISVLARGHSKYCAYKAVKSISVQRRIRAFIYLYVFNESKP